MAMEFSEMFSFLSILKDSIQILPKIWRFVVPTTAISLTLGSLFFFTFTYFYQTLLDSVNENLGFTLIILLTLLAVEILCLFLFITVSNVTGTSTVMACAAYYTSDNYSLSELLSRAVEKVRRNPWNRIAFHGSNKALILSFVVGILTGLVIYMHLIKPITIFILFVLWVAHTAFALQYSVGTVLVGVASVIEENCEGKQAVQRSEELIEGQKVKAYMLTLSIIVSVYVIVLVLWLSLGDRGSLNLMIYGLCGVNLIVLLRMFMSVVYTVFYFECKKQQQLLLVGDPVQNTNHLPAHNFEM